MSVDTLLILVPLCCALSTTLTELLKTTLANFNIKLACNIQAAISSVLTAGIVIFSTAGEVGINTPLEYACGIVGCSIITWVGSMVGYDKIKQLLEQIKEI